MPAPQLYRPAATLCRLEKALDRVNGVVSRLSESQEALARRTTEARVQPNACRVW